jgi:ATP citrate (pro-S)-lyase
MKRKLIILEKEKGVKIIGKDNVGGIKKGCLKIGKNGGMMENIIN